MNFMKNVPQGYIYSTPKNTQYQKCGLEWINLQSGLKLDESKYSKMELAAKHQIDEINEYSRFIIGESYKVGSGLYTYIGEKKFSISGGILAENASTTIYKKLTEADIPSDDVYIPNGYVYKTAKGTEYLKTPKGWESVRSGNTLNTSAAQTLDDAAKRKVAEFNKNASTPIGFIWKSKKGNEYVYVGGNRFVSPDGKRPVPNHISDQVLAQREYDNTNSKSNVSSSENDEVEVNNTITSEPSGVSNTTHDGVLSVEDLAKKINSHPQSRKITILIGRGDKMSLLAADILLSGKTKEAVDILKTLKK